MYINFCHFLRPTGIYTPLRTNCNRVLLIVGFFIFSFFIFYPTISKALNTDFTNYELGTLHGQNGWTCDPASQCVVSATSTYYYNSPKGSATWWVIGDNGYAFYHATTSNSFEQDFYFKTDWTTTTSASENYFAFYQNIDDIEVHLLPSTMATSTYHINFYGVTQKTGILYNDTWYLLQFFADMNFQTNQICINYDCTDVIPATAGLNYYQYLSIKAGGKGIVYFDTFRSWGYEADEKYINITNPLTGTTASSTFPLYFKYFLNEEDYNEAMIIFESWHASSTCPEYGSNEWQNEYDNDWFYYQSIPYFSPFLTATSTEGTSIINVYDLDENYYNCVHCYFINPEKGFISQNECPDYILNISGYIPISQPPPFSTWSQYYASHTDSKFATPTAIFGTITGSFSNVVNKLSSFVNDFKGIFNSESAYAKGQSLGSVVPLARGYLDPINEFFGELPISELFIFCIVILLVINIYRLVKTILQLIRG